jgi:hypothetical protein
MSNDAAPSTPDFFFRFQYKNSSSRARSALGFVAPMLTLPLGESVRRSYLPEEQGILIG